MCAGGRLTLFSVSAVGEKHCNGKLYAIWTKYNETYAMSNISLNIHFFYGRHVKVLNIENSSTYESEQPTWNHVFYSCFYTESWDK